MAGRESLAQQAAAAAWPAACGPAGQEPGSAIAQHYAVLPYFTRVRFGRWDALLRDTLPPDGAQPYPQAMWHYARGTALARTGRLQDASLELAQLQRLAADPALRRSKMKNINPSVELVRIAELTLQADLALADGEPQAAVARLREATAVEDALAYDEPHLWLAPTRHALGAALLVAGQPEQALRVYAEDLRHYPDNGWALGGLSLAFAQLANPPAAELAALRARAAFARADRLPVGSRF
jgi:tetratricopeptide (TPR) repeat protein